MVKFKEIEAKTILNKYKYRDKGRSLAKTIKEFLDTGKCEKLERFKTEW